MEFPLRPALQYRWKVHARPGGACVVYYGLRNPPDHVRRQLDVPADLAGHLRALDGSVAAVDLPAALVGHPVYAELVSLGVVVDRDRVRAAATPESHRECTRCVANDYLLPGLEFDERGVCALCQCYERAEAAGLSAVSGDGISDEELRAVAAGNTTSRFDVMVLCTGGKDSTFLLWYLAGKLKLRVLAASWNMPYTNETCRENLRRSMALLPDVEFVERTLPWNMVRTAMLAQFKGVGQPCLCPMAAHALFYPLAVQERIPLVMHGVEDVQMAVMNYVMSELKTGGEAREEPADHRRSTLGFLRMVANAPEPADPFGLTAEFFRYTASVRRVLDPIYGPLDEVLDRAEKDPAMPVPHMRRLLSNESYGTWANVVDVIKRELDWRMPPGQKGLLHTSCRIEKVKDHCQFNRFRSMHTTFFPQSVVELAAGVYFGLVSREDALVELAELGYMREPEALAPLLRDLGIDGDMAGLGEIPWSLDACRGCRS